MEIHFPDINSANVHEWQSAAYRTALFDIVQSSLLCNDVVSLFIDETLVTAVSPQAFPSLSSLVLVSFFGLDLCCVLKTMPF